MTIYEDLSVTMQFAYLTNTQYEKTTNSNGLMFYKLTISLLYLLVIFLQFRILIFKGTYVKFFKAIKGLKSNQNSIGGSTYLIILSLISAQMMFVFINQFVLKPNFTEPEIQGLRAVMQSQIFVIDLLPLIWILTTPKMYKCFKVKLRNFLKIFNCGYKNNFIRHHKSDGNVHNIPDEEQNEEGIELEERNLQQIDEHQDSMENPDMIDSLHVPSPDPGCPEAPMSNLILSSVAQVSENYDSMENPDKIDSLHVPSPDPGFPELPIPTLILSSVVSNCSNTLDKENENAISDSQSSTDQMQQQDPSSSTRNKKSKNIVLDRFESARNSMPNVDC